MDDDFVDLAIKAPNRHKKRLEMLSKMPKGGRCAEIGVWNGLFSAAILSETWPVELVLIDPWDLLSAKSTDEQTHRLHGDEDAMGAMFRKVSERYGALQQVKIRKGFSAEVLASFPDGYFDWLYIDGNHLYDFVLQDLKLAAKKVKLGGTIAGDDLFWKRGERQHVQDAVMDFLAAAGLPRKVDHIGQQFMIPVTEALKALP